MFKRALVIFVILAALIPFASCKEDPQAPVEDDGINWPAMTDRDDVLEMLVLTYANPKEPESIPKYRALLHSNYFFGLAPQDVRVGQSPIISRSEDVSITEKMFEYERILELALDPMAGIWTEYPEIEGQPCDNCWACQPSYFIRAQFGDSDKVFMSPVTNAEVIIVVAPDEEDPAKWVLRAMYDLSVTGP